MLTLERPLPPASMPGAGKCPGTTAPLQGRVGQGVVQVEDHLVLCHVTPAPPHLRHSSLVRKLVVVEAVGVVALEDHPRLCHVTGSPPHRVLRGVVKLEAARRPGGPGSQSECGPWGGSWRGGSVWPR